MADLRVPLPTRLAFVGLIAAGKLLHDSYQHIERIRGNVSGLRERFHEGRSGIGGSFGT